VDQGRFRVEHAPGEYMLADIGTKGLHSGRIWHLMRLMSFTRGTPAKKSGNALGEGDCPGTAPWSGAEAEAPTSLEAEGAQAVRTAAALVLLAAAQTLKGTELSTEVTKTCEADTKLSCACEDVKAECLTALCWGTVVFVVLTWEALRRLLWLLWSCMVRAARFCGAVRNKGRKSSEAEVLRNRGEDLWVKVFGLLVVCWHGGSRRQLFGPARVSWPRDVKFRGPRVSLVRFVGGGFDVFVDDLREPGNPRRVLKEPWTGVTILARDL
jgi:hypothetical protein